MAVDSGIIPPSLDQSGIPVRVQELLQQRLDEIRSQTDRRLATLTNAEWVALVCAAVWVAPRTWIGQSSSVHPHVWFAIVMGGIIASLPVGLAWYRPGHPLTRHVIAATQMLMAGMLVHMTGGRIETHFSYFGLLAFMAFYRDWTVFVTATVVACADHLARAYFWPESMYGAVQVSPWRPFEHLGWVLFEVAILSDFIRKSLESLTTNVVREARLERVGEEVAFEVQVRTAELAESEQRYRIIFESSPLPMWLCDAKTLMFIKVNQRAVQKYGYSSEEFQRMRVSEINATSDRVEWNLLINGLAGDALPMTLCSHRRKDGSTMDVELTLTPIEWAGHRAILVLSNDVSDRVLAEREKGVMEVQLRHAQKLESIGQLAAGIAHEINTPTQYVGDNLHFLSDAFQDLRTVIETQERVRPLLDEHPSLQAASLELKTAMESADLGYLIEEIPKALGQALDGIGRVSTLVKAMKEFSHPGSKEKVPSDLNSAIRSTIAVARNEWKYVARLETDLDPNLPLVPCFINDLNQVLLNLIVNAAHAIAEVFVDGALGAITISTRVCGEHAEIRVRDNGTGIPAHVRNRIFDPFFTTKAVGKGSGQGLAIARSVMVDKHGGALEFETETGRGTTFVVRLPLGAADGEIAA
jgi:PAS domain S-box-containing protein